MVLKIALVIAIIFQIIAAIVSLKLTKRTKYNLSWIFITLGFVFLLIRRVIETLPFYSDFKPQDFRLLYIWFGVASSIFFAVGLILIGKLFSYMERMEKEKRASEKRFLSIIIKAEENERRRLAKDLHDGLGPLLSTIKMSVSALKKQENNEHSKEILNNLDNVIVESIKSIKDVSNNLSPHVLDHFGLNKAINNFIDKINTTNTLKIHFKSNLNEQRFEQNIESVLYRLTCELINNTMKHANASTVNIDLNYDIYSINMRYSDDGIGFEVDNLFKPQEKSTGYYNIYSRISTLKGKIDVQSTAGKGVDILIHIPFAHD
ncbi:MAG: histidine kinase [Bacteroidales bacterium]|jgi:signal transduction histidine kinase|nr:histidine kinase [Bacteroidales bacterium]